MKVLIVKVSALGDIIHALAVLDYIKSVDNQIEIDWLVEAPFASFLETHPAVRTVHCIDTKTWRKQGLISVYRNARQVTEILSTEKYDIVFDLQGNSKSAFFTYFSGAQRRYGFDRPAVREWPNLLATNHKVELRASDHHIIDRSLAVVREAFPGGENPTVGQLVVGTTECDAIEKILSKLNFIGPLVVCHYGTTWVTKHWPLDSWRELCARLVEEAGVRPVLTWGNDAELSAAKVLYEASGERAIIWPRGSLLELAALLERADLVIGCDTGPIHIAAAVGTPTISIFRVTDAERNGPRGEQHIRVQSPLDCSPCLRKVCKRDVECGRSIDVETVWSAVMDQLSS